MLRTGAAAALIAVFALATGCGSQPLDSGLTGQVLAGPVCPVARVGHPCPPAPVAVRLRAVGPTTVHFASDATGHYRVALPPGAYTITNDTGTNLLPRCQAQATVRPHAFTQLQISCDTGIR